jgi:hypothetical protein
MSSVSGETELSKLLAHLRPVLDDTEYAFGLLPSGGKLPLALEPLGTFRESEGTTVIAPSSELAASRLAHTPGWAKITLEVHSALSAVGLTAAVSSALAEAGISANVVAAFHHDHLFVPWGRRKEAVAILEKLSAAQRG